MSIISIQRFESLVKQISTFELWSRIAFWLDSLEQRKHLERIEISNSISELMKIDQYKYSGKMRTLNGCFSYTHIVKLVFWPENYLRNRSSFVSCELHAWLILKICRFNSSQNLCNEGYYSHDLSTRPFIPRLSYLYFFNSRRVPPLLNQSLVLIPQQPAGTWCELCYKIYRLTVHNSSSVTFFPWLSSSFLFL